MEIGEGILTTIGDTPLVRLNQLFGPLHFRLYAKLEFMNPGGSSKDRPALAIMKAGMESGAVKPNTVVIESSSGNMAISLAKICSFLGLRFICVVDPRTTEQNIRIMKAYGAEIDRVTEPDRATGEYLPARIQRVNTLLESIEYAFWPNQYANPNNHLAHTQTTMREIASRLNHEVDYLFCGVSTGGTIRGCAEYVKESGMNTRIIAVDAEGSILFGGARKKRRLPGLGAAIIPPLFRRDLIDRCIHVSDLDCVTGCRKLVRKESILAGGSSGGVISAVQSCMKDIPEGAVCAVILPDRGERYLDTVYSDEWVRAQFGDVQHLWEGGG
jgi:2,3-diaminopropionate biosynthesis protein SbnA